MSGKVLPELMDVNLADIARAKIDMLFAIGWRKILDQFNLMSARRFHDREFELCTRNAGDFSRHFARLMRAVRKFEAENIAPECERSLEIRDRDARMIGSDDSKIH